MNINKIKNIADFHSVTNLKNLHLFQPIASNLEANTLTLLGHFSAKFDEGNSMRYSRFASAKSDVRIDLLPDTTATE